MLMTIEIMLIVLLFLIALFIVGVVIVFLYKLAEVILEKADDWLYEKFNKSKY